MPRQKAISPSEISVLALFKKEPLTRVMAAERHPTMTPNSVRCYITRLLKSKLLERSGDVTFSTDGKTVFLTMTDAGREALKAGPTRSEQIRQQRVKQIKPYDPLESLMRSPLYARPPYVPEKFEPARKGAMDFMKIKSKGLR